MDKITTFFSYAFGSLAFIVIFWPALCLVFVGLIGLVWTAVRGPYSRFKFPIRWTLAQLVFPAAIILVGVLFPWRGTFEPHATRWPDYEIDGFVLSHVFTIVFLVARCKEARWSMFFMSLFAFAYSLATCCVSGMAVTGVWL
jgi:hypothetical protein